MNREDEIIEKLDQAGFDKQGEIDLGFYVKTHCGTQVNVFYDVYEDSWSTLIGYMDADDDYEIDYCATNIYSQEDLKDIITIFNIVKPYMKAKDAN